VELLHDPFLQHDEPGHQRRLLARDIHKRLEGVLVANTPQHPGAPP
jgi:hypothetical protein